MKFLSGSWQPIKLLKQDMSEFVEMVKMVLDGTNELHNAAT